MFKIVVINDCRDDNARLRQEVRYGAYFAGSSVVFAGAANDVEAAFLVADALDALDGSPGVIAANVAPRNGAAKKHANGTPFGVVKVGETFVIRLRSNPSTGYMWSVAPESADLVSLTGTSSTEPPKNGMVGQPIFQIFDFKAVKRGSGVLALHYVRSWEKPAADETRFTLRITVR